jgi:hypothetical protein
MYNYELYDLSNVPEIVKTVKLGSLRWLDSVEKDLRILGV